jgi:hypothetical protein
MNGKLWSFLFLAALVLMGSGCGGKMRERSSDDGVADFRAATDPKRPGSIDDLDAKNGFRDLRFGAGVGRDMKRAERQDAEVTASYVRKGEDLRIGRAKAKQIRYVFFEDGLTSVIIETAGAENSQALLDVLWAAFGPNINRQAPVQVWNGKKNVAYFGIEPSGAGRLTLWNREMVTRAVRENEARAAARPADN